MAPPGNGYDMTAEQRNKIPLLGRYKCRICQKFKASGNFANKELKGYQNKKFLNPGTTDITAKLRCRTCAGEQVAELQCEGQCGLWKPLDKFSKTQRTKGSKWCKDCVLWKEAAEPGVTTKAAPNTFLAPDELPNAPRAFVDPEGVFDPEGGDDDDDYESFPPTTYVNWYNGAGGQSMGETSTTAPASTSQGMGSTPGAGHLRTGRSAVASTADRSYILPHLRAVVSTPSTFNPPPHLRSTQDQTSTRNSDITSQSSASNPYDTGSITTGDTGGWNIVGARQRNGLAPINPSAGTSTQRAPVPQSNGAGTWARPAGTRRAPPPQFPDTVPTVQARNVYDSDDGSDDEL